MGRELQCVEHVSHAVVQWFLLFALCLLLLTVNQDDIVNSRNEVLLSQGGTAVVFP